MSKRYMNAAPRRRQHEPQSSQEEVHASQIQGSRLMPNIVITYHKYLPY